MIDLKIGKGFEAIITWLTANLGPVFDAISNAISGLLQAFEGLLLWPHPMIVIVLFTVLAYVAAKRGIAVFTLIGMFLIYNMGFF